MPAHRQNRPEQARGALLSAALDRPPRIPGQFTGAIAAAIIPANPFLADLLDILGIDGTGDLKVGMAHDVADPAKVDVLFLQEIVVRELLVSGRGNTRASPERLHTKAFCQRAVVDILAVPLAPPRDQCERQTGRERRQEQPQDPLRLGQVLVDQQEDAHQGRHRIGHAHRQQHAAAEMHGQAIGALKQMLGRRFVGGRRPWIGIRAQVARERLQPLEDAEEAPGHRLVRRAPAARCQPSRAVVAGQSFTAMLATPGGHVEDQAVVVVRQHLAHAGSRIASTGHRLAEVVRDDLRGAAQPLRGRPSHNASRIWQWSATYRPHRAYCRSRSGPGSHSASRATPAGTGNARASPCPSRRRKFRSVHLVMEVAQVHVQRQRQRHHQARPLPQPLLRDQLVATFGQRRQHSEREIRVVARASRANSRATSPRRPSSSASRRSRWLVTPTISGIASGSRARLLHAGNPIG